ncbi:MAG: hypothetical protein ACM3S5_10355 [Rhodospirillales bacterium]
MNTELQEAVAAVDDAHRRWLESATGQLVTELDRLIGELTHKRHEYALDRSRALLAQLRGERFTGPPIGDIDKLISGLDRRIRHLERERDVALFADLEAWL